jgi:hypothetical protein
VHGNKLYFGIAGLILIILIVAAPLSATPIRPTAKQILQDARPAGENFIPARAGWNGPENQTANSANPLMQRFRPAAQTQASRESLLALLMPDFRLWTMLAGVILALRLLHQRSQRRPLRPVLLEQPPAEQPPSHLQAA